MARFNVVVPWFKFGKMHFPVDLKDSISMQECMEELGLAAKGGFKSKHDDFIDTISMLGTLSVFRPGEEDVPREKGDDDIWWEEEEDDSSTMDSYIV